MKLKLSEAIFNPAYTMRTKWATSKSDGVCLEVGSNIGRMTSSLAKSHYVVAGDVSAQFFEYKKRRFISYLEKIDFVIFDAHNLPFRDGSFHTVIMIDVLEHLKNPVNALQEARRVGTKKILINVPNYDFATVLYPNMLPEHFNEPTHQQRTNTRMLKQWLKGVAFTKANIYGSYIPLPLPLVPISFFLEYILKVLHVKPTRMHFQISCEILL